MEEITVVGEETPQQKNDKITKEFDKNFKKLVALMGGSDKMKKPIVPNDNVGKIVEELLKERIEEKVKEFKDMAKSLLDKKINFDKETKKAEEEFKKTVIQKKKEFTDEMKKVFNIVEDISEIEKSYYEGIKDATKSDSQA
jgi:hypothetical protein